MRSYSYECGACGSWVERPPTRGQAPKWCPDCQRRGNRPRPCRGDCGALVVGTGPTYCSEGCRPVARAGTRRGDALRRAAKAARGTKARRVFKHGPCVVCRTSTTSRNTPGATYCSDRCAEKTRVGECANCDRPFRYSGGARQQYCSVSCSTEGAAFAVWRDCVCGVEFAGYRSATTCQDCRRKDGHWIAPGLRAELYERDNHTCLLCFEPVDYSADPKVGDWAPTLDHIIPRSQGGSDLPENLRTAHRWCNSALGDGTRYTEDDFTA